MSIESEVPALQRVSHGGYPDMPEVDEVTEDTEEIDTPHEVVIELPEEMLEPVKLTQLLSRVSGVIPPPKN